MFHKKGVTVVGRGPLGFNWCYETIVRQKGITIGKLSADYFGARIIPSLQDGGIGWGRGSTGCTRGSFENAGDGGGRVGGCGRPRYSGSPTPPTTQRVPACPRGPRVSHPTDHPEGTRLSAGIPGLPPHRRRPVRGDPGLETRTTFFQGWRRKRE